MNWEMATSIWLICCMVPLGIVMLCVILRVLSWRKIRNGETVQLSVGPRWFVDGDGDWHNITLCCNGNDCNFYIDGAKLNTFVHMVPEQAKEYVGIQDGRVVLYVNINNGEEQNDS